MCFLISDLSSKQVSFLAQCPAETWQPNQDLVFPDVVFNKGNAYNETTGRFVAPCNGTFVFLVVLTRKITTSPDLELELVKNGNMRIAYIRNMGNPDSASVQAVLHLQVNDEVWIRALNFIFFDQSETYAQANIFSGSLLTPDP